MQVYWYSQTERFFRIRNLYDMLDAKFGYDASHIAQGGSAKDAYGAFAVHLKEGAVITKK